MITRLDRFRPYWIRIKSRYEQWERRAVAGKVAGWSLSRRLMIFVLLPAFLLCCCGGIVGVPLLWLAGATVQAGRGALSADDAASLYLVTLSGALRPGANENGLLPTLYDADQDELLGQWRAYRDQMKAANPAPVGLSWKSITAERGEAGQAVVRVDVQAEWWLVDEHGRNTMWNGGYLTWAFETVNDDGWRVSRVTPPPWCGPGGYLTQCGAAPPAAPTSSPPSAIPSDDPLRGPREMLRCGAEDPFREWHSCPPLTSSDPPAISD